MKLLIKYTYLFIISLFVFACASDMKSAKHVEASEVLYDDIEAPEEKSEIELVDSQNEFIKNKFEDFYDLLSIKQTHPNFSNDIAKQLQSFTNDSLNAYNYKLPFRIENIRIKPINSDAKINKATVKILFDVVSKHTRIKDSIWATTSTKIIVLDGDTFTSNKVKFSKLKQ